MKLLLTSAGWWKNPEIGKVLVKLVNKKPAEIRIFLVITPTKYLKRNKFILRQFRQFKGIRIPEQNVTFFQLDRKVKKDELKNIDVVFVFGGNTFDYMDRIKTTGLDKLIKAFVKKGGVYLGLSAGSYVVCPTIEAASWKHADANTAGLKDLRGLNFVPFLITAHFEEGLRSIIEKAAKNTKYQVIALTDKQAVLIKGKSKKIIGSGKKNIFNLLKRRLQQKRRRQGPDGIVKR
ncbi:MAG: Type 1 glutamine amidotransferase-like domain-containing protein [Patescibacteria group bacterium]|nr:Type 1 glutamine amidotransferase-like domain-containing protein [Patescibacteria group bacterium]